MRFATLKAGDTSPFREQVVMITCPAPGAKCDATTSNAARGHPGCGEFALRKKAASSLIAFKTSERTSI